MGLAAPFALALSCVLGAEPDLEEDEVVRRDETFAWELGTRAEIRTGQPEGTAAGSNLTELQLDPVVALRLPYRTGGLTLGYFPRLLVIAHQPNTNPTRTFAVLHRGLVTWDWNPTTRWRLFVNARGARGQYDFLPLSGVVTPAPGTGTPPTQEPPGAPPPSGPPTPGSGPSTLPAVRFILVYDLDASAGTTYALSPTVRLVASGGYVYSGGATPEARAQLPLEQGPKGAAGLVWNAGRSDDLSFGADATRSRFSTGSQATVLDLTTTWSHVWSRSLASELVAGAGGFHGTTPTTETGGQRIPGREETKLLPVGGLGVRHTIATRSVAWRNALTLLAAPLPDRISGQVFERLTAVARSSLEPVPRVLLDVTAGSSKTLDTEQHDVRLEAKTTFQILPEFGISVGGRVAWLGGSPLLPGFGWVGFVAIGTFVGTPLIPTSI